MQHAPTNVEHEMLLNHLVALNLSLMVLIRIMQIPEEPTPTKEIEAVLLRLSNAADILLNPLISPAEIAEGFEATASPCEAGRHCQSLERSVD